MNESARYFDFLFYRGRVALAAALRALDIGPGDEVAIQAFTCVAVPEAIIAVGATPIYVDIESDSYNMCPTDLLSKLSKNTSAVVIQHTFGIPAKLDQLTSICENRNIPIIEDCCHTYCSTSKNTLVGSVGVASFCSFEWGKPLIGGIGGGLYVRDESLRKSVEEIYQKYSKPPVLKELRLLMQYCGFKALYRPSMYWFLKSAFKKLSGIGLLEGNYSSSYEATSEFDLSISKGAEFFARKNSRKLNSIEHHSLQISQVYISELTNYSLPLNVRDKIVFSRYPLVVSNKEELLKDAENNRVEIAGWYHTPVHPLKENEYSLVHYIAGSCPNAELRTKEVITLPTHLRVSMEDAKNISQFINYSCQTERSVKFANS